VLRAGRQWADRREEFILAEVTKFASEIEVLGTGRVDQRRHQQHQSQCSHNVLFREEMPSSRLDILEK
jgi:hypothetical protein